MKVACHAGPDYAAAGGGGMVLLDDCNFHESVKLDDFDLDRTLTLVRFMKVLAPSPKASTCYHTFFACTPLLLAKTTNF